MTLPDPYPGPRWTKHHPSRPGYYWFYGRINRAHPNLYMLASKLDDVGDRLIFQVDGVSRKLDELEGYFLRVIDPEIPTDPDLGY